MAETRTPETTIPTMSTKTMTDGASLEELRREIDAIDAQMHALLMRRGGIVDAVTAAKRSREGGAFRPDREADMMRALVARHRGGLPLVTVEHLWREIISTFTQLQSAYTVHLPSGSSGLVDLARFSFGFSTPLAHHASASEVAAAVAASRNDLGLVPLEAAAGDAWWRGLGEGAAVMARLPFLRLPQREAGTPALVISRPLSGVRPFDRAVVRIEGSVALTVEAERLAGDGEGALLAVPGGAFEDLLSAHTGRAVPAGGYFDPLDLGRAA